MRTVPHPDQPTLFDGKVCTKCGFWHLFTAFSRAATLPDGHSVWCKACHSGYGRTHPRTPEQRARDNANRRAKYALATPEEKRAMADRMIAKYHSKPAMRAKVIGRVKAAYRRNPEQRRTSITAWRRTHPEHVRATRHRRRSRVRGAGGKWTGDQWRALCDWFGNVCLACGEAGPLTVDHVIPLAKDGANTIENLQPLCLPCNMAKGLAATDYRAPEQVVAFLLAWP